MSAANDAIAQEAELTAEHLAIGVSALGKANYAQQAYYYEAFFALTIGLERAAKLALVIDYALDNSGNFPSNKTIRKYSHRLSDLLTDADRIAERRGFTEARLPRSPIHDRIVEILSDFASNITRYYNLDIITRHPSANQKDDPVGAWFERVTSAVLATHYRPQYAARHERNARLISAMLDDDVFVRYHSETGDVIDSLYEGSKRTAATRFAARYTRMYVMQIARFVAELLSELGHIAQREQLSDVPYLAEIYRIFRNSDRYFRQRKTWSIYRP